jgi:hypothetical protein
MNRRTFLTTTIAGAGLAATAGCSLPGGPESFGRPEVTVDDDGREKHLTYQVDDTRQAVVSLMQRGRPESPTDRFGLRLYVWHREGLSIDRLHYRLRAPPHSVKPPAEIYLKTPDGGPWPAFDLNTDDDLWTVVDVDDIGELGDGSLGLELIVEPGSEPVEEMAVHPEITLSSSGAFGGKRVAEATERFEPVFEG